MNINELHQWYPGEAAAAVCSAGRAVSLVAARAVYPPAAAAAAYGYKHNNNSSSSQHHQRHWLTTVDFN